jgi:uridine kinase
MVCIVGIAGRSCAGKTTVAKTIFHNYSDTMLYLCQNIYFKRHADDWESPLALDNRSFFNALVKLKHGESAYIPSHAHKEMCDKKIEPQPIVIVEGYQLFSVPEIVNICDVRIYLDVSDLNILYRRTKKEGCIENMDAIMSIVIPRSYTYMNSQKRAAHIVINGNKSKEEVYHDIVQYLDYHQLI